MATGSRKGRWHFETSGDLIFVAKLWMPVICFLGVLLLLPHGRPAGKVLLGLIGLAGLFYLTLVSIRVGANSVEYRRWWKWKTIAYRDILECSDSRFLYGFGYLRLNRFVPPWGRLYFMRESSRVKKCPDVAADGSIADYIARRAMRVDGLSCVSAIKPASTDEERGETTLKGDIAKCILLFLAGAAWTSVFIWTTGFSVDNQGSIAFPRSTPLRRVVSVWLELGLDATKWPWVLAIGVLFVIGICLLRFKKAAWPFSITLGALVSIAAYRTL